MDKVFYNKHDNFEPFSITFLRKVYCVQYWWVGHYLFIEWNFINLHVLQTNDYNQYRLELWPVFRWVFKEDLPKLWIRSRYLIHNKMSLRYKDAVSSVHDVLWNCIFVCLYSKSLWDAIFPNIKRHYIWLLFWFNLVHSNNLDNYWLWRYVTKDCAWLIRNSYSCFLGKFPIWSLRSCFIVCFWLKHKTK